MTTSRKTKFSTQKVVTLAMMCAISFVVMWLSKLLPPLIPTVGFLKYDAKDIIIALSGFMFGPLDAVIISVVVSLIEMITISDTGIIGFLMNIISTCAFVLPAAIIYARKPKLSSAIVGLVISCVVVSAVMMLWNYVVTPYYMKVPRDLVVSLLLPGFLPFNLIKSVINAALTMLIYKPLVIALRSAKLLPESSSGKGGSKSRINIGVIIGAVIVLAMCVLFILAENKVI